MSVNRDSFESLKLNKILKAAGRSTVHVSMMHSKSTTFFKVQNIGSWNKILFHKKRKLDSLRSCHIKLDSLH